MLGKLLLKTFYGHTVGELLALEVALVGTIESFIAAELATTVEAREELTDVVLSKLSRERQLQILRELLDRSGDEAAATVEQGIRAVYKLRDRFAHGGLVGDGITEDGWLLTAKRGSKKPASPVSQEEVERVIADGKTWLAVLTEAVEEMETGSPGGPSDQDV